MRSLQRDEAVARFDLLTDLSYDVTLDLREEQTFHSRTVIDLRSCGGATFLDVKPTELLALSLDGAGLPVDALAEGRYPLDLAAGDHQLVVEALMPFRNDGEGLHRAVDPADGRPYVYQMSFMSAAPSVFACFDQPDLKAPYTLHVTAPTDWVVIGNAPGEQVEQGCWEFARSQPLSTYFVSLVAGPYHRLTDSHDGIDLGLLCRASMAAALEQDAEEIFTITKQCFDEFHRLFGIRYAFGKYDQAFVPEFNAGAMENPGCVTFRDPLIFTTKVPRSLRIQRATTVAHEMAHQWFGNLVTPRWWDDLWLNEAFAEYMGNRVAAAVTEFSEALVWAAVTRRNWGLTSDARPSTHPVAGTSAQDADTALQDFDGISYAKGHAVLTQLATQVGDDVFFGGVRDHFEQHRFGNATMRDLFDSWERAGAGDLTEWTTAWLRTAGLDTLDLDRSRGVLVRTSPAETPVQRTHAVGVLVHDGTSWQRTDVEVDGDETPLVVPEDAAVILDPDDRVWASLTFDEVSAKLLPPLIDGSLNALTRASIWTTARNGVHHARLDPEDAVALLAAGIPFEDQDSSLGTLTVWAGDDGDGTSGGVHEKLLPVVRDARASRARVHRAFRTRAESAPAGSELQLAAARGWIATNDDAASLRALLDEADLPGLVVDSGLRWRALRRLSSLGAVDLDELDRELARDRSAECQVAHAWAHARLPDAAAKAWAWQRFTGEQAASNYEVEAIGTGFWQIRHDDLLTPYVDRYFAELPGTTAVRAGWGLADAGRFFYPITVVEPDTLRRTDELLEDESLNLSLRRVLVDAGDELRSRLHARERYGTR